MIRALLVSSRPAQWSKNLFVLAPLVFSRSLGQPDLLLRGILAFVVFSAGASAAYFNNDLRDRERDRSHPLKRLRPLASGQLTPIEASVAGAGLAGLALAGALVLGRSFVLLLAAYLILNLLYSAALKKIVIVDVMAVSFGYVLRVEAGAAAIDVEVSTWILLCTTFVALFLAFSKRRHELLLLPSANDHRDVLSHYSPTFLDQMINVVTASTLLSYSLYVVAPETVSKFDTTSLIYTVPFVLFGIFRYLYLVYQVDDERNPTEAILYDLPSVVNLVLWGSSVVILIYLL